MYQFEGILRNLLSIAKQEKSNYFEERLKSIQEKFELFRPIEITRPIEKFSMLKKAEVVGQFNYYFNPFLYSSKK